MSLQWDGKFGPASIIGVAQLLLFAAGGVVVVQRMQDGIDTAKAQVVEVRSAVDELRRASASTGERVTRVEAQTDFVARSLDRIEKKVDSIKSAP